MLPLWFANILGWIVAHKRLVLTIGGIILLLLLVLMIYRGCRSTPKLDEAEIQKGEQAVKERNDEALRKILVESEAREAVIDANVANAEKEKVEAVEQAKERWANANISDLQAEFDRRKNQ
jgi:uncharacterized membrane protein